MVKRVKRPRDPAQLANLVMQIATGEVSDEVEDKRNPAAVALGKLGGAKGGKARAKSLTAKQRKDIAKKAAQSRWKKN
jgi:hypothetical protein